MNFDQWYRGIVGNEWSEENLLKVCWNAAVRSAAAIAEDRHERAPDPQEDMCDKAADEIREKLLTEDP